MLDQDGQLLDSRNRLAACEIAGVEPVFTTYEGDDPAGYALAANITRRHLTKGQQAMIVVKANSLVTKETGWKSKLANENGLKAERISLASMVLKYAPDLVDKVIGGMVSLDTAYATAREHKEHMEAIARRVEGLRTEFADLAQRVTAEGLTLGEALTLAAERQLAKEKEEEAFK